MDRKKVGRPSKGERRMVRTRVSVAVHAAFYTEAARRGITVTDFLGELMAREVGVPYSSTQEALPRTA